MNNVQKRREVFLTVCQDNNLKDDVVNWSTWKRFWVHEKKEEDVIKRFLQWKNIAG